MRILLTGLLALTTMQMFAQTKLPSETGITTIECSKANEYFNVETKKCVCNKDSKGNCIQEYSPESSGISVSSSALTLTNANFTANFTIATAEGKSILTCSSYSSITGEVKQCHLAPDATLDQLMTNVNKSMLETSKSSQDEMEQQYTQYNTQFEAYVNQCHKVINLQKYALSVCTKYIASSKKSFNDIITDLKGEKK